MSFGRLIDHHWFTGSLVSISANDHVEWVKKIQCRGRDGK